MPTENLRAVESVGIDGYLQNWADRSGTSFCLSSPDLKEYSSRYLLVQFSEPSGDNKYRSYVDATIHAYVNHSKTFPFDNNVLYFLPLGSKFDPAKVTYKNYFHFIPTSGEGWSCGTGGYNGYFSYQLGDVYDIDDFLKHGLCFETLAKKEETTYVETSRSGSYPYLDVTFGDIVTSRLKSLYPYRDSTINNAEENEFSFDVDTDEYCYSDISAVNGHFQWKSEENGEVHKIPMVGRDCTVSKGTFPKGKIYYSFDVTLNSGQRVSSDWISLNVVQPELSISYTYPQADSTVNREAPNNFSFTTYGYHEVSGAELKTTTGEFRWRSLGSEILNSIALVNGKKDLTVPAKTFPEGELEYSFHVNVNNGQILDSTWLKFNVVAPTLVISSTSPQGGSRINRNSKTSFLASTQAWNEVNSGDIKITEASFAWRVKGEAQENNTVLTGNVAVEIPEATFPSGEIEYIFRFKTNFGQAVDSGWITLSTLDTLSTCKGISPDGGASNANEPITFRWLHINESGTAPTASKLCLQKDGAEDYIYYDVEGAETSFTVPGWTLSNGYYSWWAQTFNIDGQEGAWSEPLRFLAVGASPAPPITIENTSPRPAISWQSVDQTGYQIQLDNEIYETYYGTKNRWKCGKYLDDGPHRIKLRYQNSFQLWSAWSEIGISVNNNEGPTIMLDAKSADSVELNWTGDGYDYFIVYRNGVPIAKTQQRRYIDHWSAGDVRYFVRGCYISSGNYGKSPELIQGCYPKELIIKALGGPSWLKIGLNDEQYRTYEITHATKNKAVRLSGRRHPVILDEPFDDDSISVTFATDSPELILKIKSLKNKTVCLKTPGGEAVVGRLNELIYSEGIFYSKFFLTVVQTDFEEEIDIDL